MEHTDLRYSETHEWVSADGELATVGITEYAQSELGDIVYVELPRVGRVISAGEAFGVVESVKTVSDLISPVSGEIVEVNEDLPETPETLNEDPYKSGWLIIVKLTDASEPDGLMSAEEYEEFLQGL